MDEETKKRLDVQDEILESIYLSVEKTRKYFLWTFIATVVAFVFPLAGLLFVIPQFLRTYMQFLGGL